MISLTKVILDFSDEWLTMARKAHAMINLIRAQEKQPRISFENWLKTILALALSQTFAEVETMESPPVKAQRGPGRGKPEPPVRVT